MNKCVHKEHVPRGEKVDKKHIFEVYNPTFTNINDRRVCHCGGIFNVNYRRLHLKTRTHEEWETFISIINKTGDIPKIDINHDGVVKYRYFMEGDNIKREILNIPEPLPNGWDCAKDTIELLLDLFESTSQQHIKLFNLHRACTVSAMHMLKSKYYMRLYIKLAKQYTNMCEGLF